MSSDSRLTAHGSRLRVAIYYNLPSRLTPGDEAASEAGVLDQTEAFRAALASLGHEVHLIGAGYELGPALAALQAILPDVVVNFCEAFGGLSRLEAPAVGVLDLLGLPYTGAPADAISLLQNKPRTKLLLGGAGLPTPEFVALDSAPAGACRLGFPVILKPACADASIGLDQQSVVSNDGEYERQLARLLERHGPPVLVERYIGGREFDVAVIEAPEPRALPVSEIVFSPELYELSGSRQTALATHDLRAWPILTYAAKWDAASPEYVQSPVHCPAEVEPGLACRLQELALEAYRVTGCRDYARVDFRVSEAGEPYILEVNPNPDLSPTAGFALALQAARIDYAEFAAHLVKRAAARDDRARRDRAGSSMLATRGAPGAPEITLRPLREADRPALAELLHRAGVFRPDEIDVALELIDAALASGPASGYHFVVAELGGRVAAYACFGPVPMTLGIWDLYWIVVEAEARGRGVARALQEEMEQRIKAAGGRLLLAETSSTPPYEPAHRFYRRQGYEWLERIPDFYRPGDDRLTFGKKLC